MIELEAGIVGRDRDALVAFYETVMGFEVIQELHLEAFGTVVKLQCERARVKLFFPVGAVDPSVDVDPWFRPGGWRYAALSVATEADVHAIVAAVATAGGRVVLTPTAHRPNALTALVTDPEGNHWELLWEARSHEDPPVSA